ncbi:MAG: sugar ABC transporter permease [Spirochaetaceae bacterium]|jgi:putative multiple sugar transport system permease protein|nr:sugar ABC transporter permease [Spirochaetaceae bacterium]
MSGKVIHTVNSRTLIRNNIRNYSMFIMLGLIMVIFGPLTDWRNFSDRNITNIFFQYSYVLILATGMVQCIIILGIDLSVGSVCAFVGALSAFVYNRGVGMPVTVLCALLLGFLVGVFQGWFIAYPKIPAFIVTLAGMMLFRGLTYIVTDVNPVSFADDGYSYFSTGTVDELLHLEPTVFGRYPAAFVVVVVLLLVYWAAEFLGRQKKIANNFEVTPGIFFVLKLIIISLLAIVLAERFASYRGLPVIVIVLGITIGTFHFIMNNTVLGRYIYAVGGNARSAKLSGINSEFITFIVFCIMGTLSGLAAVVSTGYMNSALPQAGNMFEMDAIAACYIGGVSASGGIGSIVGVIVGGLVMSAINNGMFLMNLGTHYQYVVKALILLLAVYYDVYTRRKAGLG